MTSSTANKAVPTTWNRRTWHRRASRPVTWWLIALVVAGLIHPILPEYRWILIHLFTLGAVTNSIVVWSQHFTERFLHLKVPGGKRPAQLRKIAILNVGIIITVIGQLLADALERNWIIVHVGSAVVAAALVWHAISLARQFLTAERGQRFAPAVIAYVASACCLPLGAAAGALAAMELPGTWHERLLLAHTVANILGFLGFAALGSLSVLFAAVWRTKLSGDRTLWSVMAMSLAIPVTIAAVLLDHGIIAAGGLTLYALAWVASMVSWYRAMAGVLVNPRDRVGFASVSVAAAPLWLIGSLIYLIIGCVRHDGELYMLTLPTIALVVGFAAQLLIGMMSYLLPSTIGGGPAAVRTGTQALGKAGLFRVVMVNGGLIIWLLTDDSWLRVTASLLALGSLAAFIPLMITAVRAQRGVLTGTCEPSTPPDAPRTGQLTAGIAVLALVLAAFGGLSAQPAPNTGPTDGTSTSTTVSIDAGDMTFEPDVIEVPLGEQLQVTLVNVDDMVHDLKFDNGVQTGRVAPGDEVTVTVGTITEDMDGWCTIAGHRVQGMDLSIIAVDQDADQKSDSSGTDVAP